MWIDTTRAQYTRAQLALPSDLTDAEWALMEPFFPSASYVGRSHKWPLRRIVEVILNLLRGILPLRMLPPYFPRYRGCGASSTYGATIDCRCQYTMRRR